MHKNAGTVDCSGVRSRAFKDTVSAAIGPPATARAASARSSLPLSTAGYETASRFSQSVASPKDLRQPAPSIAHHLPTDTCQTDPDLAAVVAAWPDLPEAIKAGILAMVKASKR